MDGLLYLWGALTLVAFFTIVYVIALVRDDYSTVDVFWGMAQVALSLVLFIIVQPVSLTQGLILIMVVLWGLRLSIYLYMRNWHKPEDFRYQAMRKKWHKAEKLQAYVKVFLLQSGFAFLMGITLITVLNYELESPVLFIAGLVIFVIGLVFETVGDAQMMRFRRTKQPGEIMQKGVWGLSRHPNYFGEVTAWWGIGFMALAHVNTFGAVLLILISPVTITFLLLGLSGIPLLEKKYAGNDAYDAYKQKVRAFFPFPKK